MPRYELTYPSRTASEGEMYEQVLGLLRKHGLSPHVENRIMLAISEAFTNALVHGNRREAKKEIKLIININEKEVTADVMDEGEGGLERINRRLPPTVHSEGGRGIDLIRHYSDDVRFEEKEQGGLRVSMRFDVQKKNSVMY